MVSRHDGAEYALTGIPKEDRVKKISDNNRFKNNFINDAKYGMKTGNGP